MYNITLIKGISPKVSITTSIAEDVFKTIKEKVYAEELVSYRLSYPYAQIYSDKEREYRSKLTIEKEVPRVCFSGVYHKKKGEKTLVERNPLVLIEAENLIDFKFADDIRNRASTLPYTYMTFIGADGRSVRIVCKVALTDGSLPSSDSDWEKFMGKAYDNAHFIYSSFLKINIPKRMPYTDRTCLMSADGDAYFHADSEPIRIDVNREVVEDYEVPQVASIKKEGIIPGKSELEAQRMIFYACLRKAFEDAGREDDNSLKALNLLAPMCHDSGLPLSMCTDMCRYYYAFKNLGDVVDSVFNAVYDQDLRNILPQKYLSPATLLSYKTEYFLKTHYMLRKNVLSGAVQYKEMISFSGDWRIVDDAVRNTMTINAQKHGLNSWDKDMNRFINSTLVKQYDPIAEYLRGLDEWDGTDYVAAFARRVPTSNPNWESDFHTWMLGMVAHWMNRDRQHGNSTMPLLIGGQGTGKTSFSRIILPPELRMYYTDKIDLKNESTVNAAMAGYALINIDEFDSLTKSAQPRLKMLMSMASIDSREMYKSSMSRRRRYASFISSTNNMRPILDYTGSRRFICVPVEGLIDFQSPVDYRKLYSQLVAELNSGVRYYFDDDDNQRIMNYNLRFRKVTDMKDMISAVFRSPMEGEEGELWNLSDISNVLRKEFVNFSQSKNINHALGRLLSEMGFQKKHTRTGNPYMLVCKLNIKY